MVSLGTISLTEGAVCALAKAVQTVEQLLARHLFCDWGELDEEDWKRNDFALQNDLSLLSSYRLRDNTMVWILTESDRTRTTVLLPSEY